MNLADLLIVIVLVVSVVSAFVKGFFVEVFSLAGVILGLFIAAANYGGFSLWVLRVVHNREAANLIAFLLIALSVMLVAALVGRLLRGLFRGRRLGYCRSTTRCSVWVGGGLCGGHAGPDGHGGIFASPGLVE